MANIPFLNNAYFSAKVGIGTDSPIDVLSLEKTTNINVLTDYKNSTGNFSTGVLVGGNFAINESNVATRLTIEKTSGNVGIGTISPYAKLSVNDGTNINLGIKVGQTDATAVMLNAYNDAVTANIPMEFRASKFNFENGNVGIGTTSPDLKLDVTHATSGEYVATFQNTAANLELKLGVTSTNYLNIQGQQINNSAAFNMSLQADGGNVGIGTTTPGEKLDVAGNIKIQAALLSNQDNTDVDTGTETVANVAIATYTAAFFDFVIKKTTNVRSGTVYACHDGTNVEFTETSTNDLGNTSDVTLSVDISGGNMRLLATVTSDDWSVKSLIRAI